MKPVALFDLDGTLCNFDAAMTQALKSIASPFEPEEHVETAYQDLAYMQARRRLIKSVPGFWRCLTPIQLGMDLVDMACRHGYQIMVLTKGPRESIAWSEKVEWCARWLPNIPVTVTKDKSLVYGRVLVDDWPEYYEKWLANRPRGWVLVPPQKWNEEAKTLARVRRVTSLDVAEEVFEQAMWEMP